MSIGSVNKNIHYRNNRLTFYRSPLLFSEPSADFRSRSQPSGTSSSRLRLATRHDFHVPLWNQSGIGIDVLYSEARTDLESGDKLILFAREARGIAERESLTVPAAALMISWALEREFCLPPRRSSSSVRGCLGAPTSEKWTFDKHLVDCEIL